MSADFKYPQIFDFISLVGLTRCPLELVLWDMWKLSRESLSKEMDCWWHWRVLHMNGSFGIHSCKVVFWDFIRRAGICGEARMRNDLAGQEAGPELTVQACWPPTVWVSSSVCWLKVKLKSIDCNLLMLIILVIQEATINRGRLNSGKQFAASSLETAKTIISMPVSSLFSSDIYLNKI